MSEQVASTEQTAAAALNAAVSHIDIAIIGGGMAGLALGLLLAAKLPSKTVAVLEQGSQPALDSAPLLPSFDARSTALAAGSEAILADMGVWQRLAANAQPIRSVHVSEKRRPFGVLMRPEHIGRENLGFVVENRELGRALYAATRALPNLSLRYQQSVSALQFDAARAQLNLADGSALTAQLVVVADGAQSNLREQLAITTRHHDYGQVAIVANVQPELPHQGQAYERFTSDGPMALLPLTDVDGRPRQALIWTMPPAKADELLALDDQAFLDALYLQFGRRVGRFVNVSARSSYPLQLFFAEEQVRSRLVIAGSAAHHLHPVAGQGFNLILRDCRALAQCLARGEDLGCVNLLASYQQAQALDQFQTVQASDLLPKLFSNSDTAAAIARQAVLLGLDFAPEALNQFARRAAGL